MKIWMLNLKTVIIPMRVINNSVILQNTVKHKDIHILRIGEISFSELRKGKRIFLVPTHYDESYVEMLEVTDIATDYINVVLYSWNRDILSQMYGYICELKIAIGEKGKIIAKGIKSSRIKYYERKKIPDIFKNYVAYMINMKNKKRNDNYENSIKIPYIETLYKDSNISFRCLDGENKKIYYKGFDNVTKILLLNYNLDCGAVLCV